ncbi:hypothetical protein FQN60_007076 [Etheostoma spectabile]|uniref:Uncharacterized protein n=1 Tax=Etheostoma spectabile TaxID=54343 RepID=A0A5J5C919_9PERO|nr:hypothetical protein FQN60_007076 [Etheostoma spectabile]
MGALWPSGTPPETSRTRPCQTSKTTGWLFFTQC